MGNDLSGGEFVPPWYVPVWRGFPGGWGYIVWVDAPLSFGDTAGERTPNG